MKKEDKIFNSYVKIFTKKYGIKTTTYSDTLHKICKTELGTKFKGVFSSDTYPLDLPNYSYAIVNNKPSSSKGQHWVACYNTPTKYYIFDSFGRSSKTLLTKLHKRMKGTGKRVKDSDYDSDQKDNQVDCGIRCLAWLMVVKKNNIYTAIKI